ncbi:MAG TPA: WYL domain-containing protein [Pirellulales bacterium]|nr:WYL domain-containing protein [Pirellulales bacterium]
MKLARITRLLELITLLQVGRGQNATSLASECRVSRRTIFRDLDILRQAGVPVQFFDDDQRYRIAGAVLLPPTNFTPQEALSLIVLSQELGQSSGIPLYHAARSAAIKLESSLPGKLRDYLRDATRAVHVKLDAANPLIDHEPVYQALLAGITLRRCVRIGYESFTERKRINTKLSPYRLLFNRRSWYVIGRSSLHRAVRTFNVGRIEKIELLDDTFSMPRGFRIDRVLRNAWNLMAERGPDHDVTIRFEKLVARNVAEVVWHKSQRVEFHPDGTLDFHVRVSGLEEISWWVLGYGDQAYVLRPKQLRQIVLDRCRRLLHRARRLEALSAGD